MSRLLLLLAALPLTGLGAPAQEPKADLPRLLFHTHSAGFAHSGVRREAPDRLAHAERALPAGAKGRMEIHATQDCSEINAENLTRYVR